MNIAKPALAVMVALALAGCGAQEGAPPAEPQQKTTETQPVEQETEQAEPQPGGPDYDPAEDEYGAPDYSEEIEGAPEGEWVTLMKEYPDAGYIGEWEVRVTDTYWNEELRALQGDVAPLADGMKWVAVQYESHNLTGRPNSASWEVMLLTDSGDMFATDFEDDYWMNTNSGIQDKVLNPREKHAQFAVFRVPDELTPLQVMIGDIYIGTRQESGVFDLSPKTGQ